MHVLFVHKNFPAQFGHIARHLVQERGWRDTFLSQTPPGEADGIRKLRYRTRGGATARTHYCARTFENAIWEASGVYEALRPLKAKLAPDLIVGHSGFGSTLFLPELFPDAPIVNYFEFYYHPHDSDLDFRREWPVAEQDVLRSRARNAMLLLDLETCAAGYAPTAYQRGLLPAAYRPKVRVIHDGIDVALWRRPEAADLRLPELGIDPGTPVVTYVSRGFESMRGFDLFMRVAKRIYQALPEARILAVGSDRVCYGGDLKHIREKSFREHVLRQDDYDLDRIRFLGQLPPPALARLLARADLHLYFTVPFVLSWSLLDAMACACVIIASDTAPVREVIRHGEDGLLFDFYDVEGMAAQAVEVLRRPEGYRPLGEAAARRIRETYSLEVTLPKMMALYESVLSGRALRPSAGAAPAVRGRGGGVERTSPKALKPLDLNDSGTLTSAAETTCSPIDHPRRRDL